VAHFVDEGGAQLLLLQSQSQVVCISMLECVMQVYRIVMGFSNSREIIWKQMPDVQQVIQSILVKELTSIHFHVCVASLSDGESAKNFS
jgi:hypothetical protein